MKLGQEFFLIFNDTDIRQVLSHFVIHWDLDSRLAAGGRRYRVDELPYIRVKYLRLKKGDFYAP